MTSDSSGDGLAITGLRKAFGDIQALDGVDLHVPRGHLVGFLGPNGAGKTTTMRTVLGLTAVDDGTVHWDGHPMNSDDRSNIGYMPQERGLYPRMRVHEHIAYIGRLAGLDHATADHRANEWAERVGLAGRADDLIETLSTGNQQRVQLAVSLVHEPQLLILDEPFAGLDPVAVSMLSDVMNEQVANGTSVVFSSHQLELVQDLARDVTIIATGTTRATGRVADLRAQSSHRILDITWAQPRHDNDTLPWAPRDSITLASSATTGRYQVGAQADPGALIAAAAQQGALASVSFEPPGLEDIFLELVQS